MTLNCNGISLKKGNNGDTVKELQKILGLYGFYTGNVDGVFGSVTETSVKSFQSVAGVTVDGWVGSATCKKLNGYLTIINDSLKKGSTNVYVYIVQQKLQQLGYYTSKVDKYYGDKTIEAVKSYQRNNKLLVDGIVGTVTYNSLMQSTSKINNNDSTRNSGIYTITYLCEKSGGNCLGQITGYHCGPHSIKQCLRHFGITGYSESTIGGYAGTTSAGTGHAGLETAIAKIAKNEGIKLKVEWFNFSDLGNNNKERFKKYGELMSSKDKAVFWHELYRNQFGHYSLPKTVNTNNSNLTIANSLGSKCNSPAYCGYFENRSFSTQISYFNGISQKSICVITKTG